MLSVAAADTAGERLCCSLYLFGLDVRRFDSCAGLHLFHIGADYMKKVIFSFFLALTVSFTVVSPVVYSAASEPQGVDAAEANIGDIIDKTDEIVGFLNDFMSVVHNVKDFLDNTDDPLGEVKAIVDDMFIGCVSSAVSLLPGGDFINLIAGWVGLYDFSITDYFGSKVQEFCNANQSDMLEFYNLYMLPCYGSVDSFVDDIYGDEYDPESGVISTGDTMSNIGEGAGSFISGVLTPIVEYCVNSEICLAFLAVCFAALGFRLLRRSVGAFVRGR